VSRKFYPVQQHDSHEFLIYMLSNLEDEETPIATHAFDGSVGNKQIA
jgi:uncharacterized UBP type Zn finger protein